MNLKRLVIWSIIGTGISSVTTQLLTVREFLSQFHGNEITISLVLFCWLIVTGLGSLAAKVLKRPSLSFYSLITLVIAVWPLVQLVGIRMFRETFFTHGVSPGFYPIFLYILFTITPYCVLTGYILPYAQHILQARHYEFESGELYLTDNIGDITGGLVFSFFLVYWVKPFLTVALTSALLILVAHLIIIHSRRYVLLFIALITTSLFFYYASNSRFEWHTLAEQYGRIVQYVESPYGRIVVSKETGQHTFWESGSPLYSDVNIISSEEKVHYPLCQLDQVKSVLLVSGGLGETISEVAKYQPEHVDYVELDPHLTETALDLHVIKKSSFLEIMNTDGRRYIKTSRKTYDAIIIDLPDPDTFQINRFFTSEFFVLAKRILKEGGILSLSMEYSPNYISDIRKKKFSTLYNTARAHFRRVLIIPGGEAYFLCRDGKLWSDVPDRLARKAIKTAYIEGTYYGNVTKERMTQIKSSLDRNEYINTDFEPRLMNIVFQEWLAKHGGSPKYFLMILAALTVSYLLFMRKEEYILFSTGLATMGAEMLVIFAFQVIYGYVYLMIGAIVTAFLTGLLPGALIGNFWRRRDGSMLMFSEVLLLVFLSLFLAWVVYFRNEIPVFYFLAYCFCFSLVCGFQFPVAARIIGERASPAAGLIAADLSGASLGTLLIGAILIPLWGIRFAVIFLILVKISSSMIMLFKVKR